MHRVALDCTNLLGNGGRWRMYENEIKIYIVRGCLF